MVATPDPPAGPSAAVRVTVTGLAVIQPRPLAAGLVVAVLRGADVSALIETKAAADSQVDRRAETTYDEVVAVGAVSTQEKTAGPVSQTTVPVPATPFPPA